MLNPDQIDYDIKHYADETWCRKENIFTSVFSW